LGVRLVDLDDGGIFIQNSSISSLVSDVKAKQYLDPLLVDLKKSISKKVIEAFSLGEIESFDIKVDYVFLMLVN